MWPATSTDPRGEKVLRSNVSKSLLKGTIAVALLSPFLEIGPSTYVNYLIFLASFYGLLAAYMLFKRSTVYALGEDGITVRRLFHSEYAIRYDNVQELSYAQGMLAKRFGCGSVYLVMKSGKGPLKSLSGEPVHILKDVQHPVDVYNEISNLTSPFAATV